MPPHPQLPIGSRFYHVIANLAGKAERESSQNEIRSWRPFPPTGHTGYLQQCFIFMKNSGTCQKKQWKKILTEYKQYNYILNKVLKDACGVKQNQTLVAIFPPIFSVLFIKFYVLNFLVLTMPGLAVAYIGT